VADPFGRIVHRCSDTQEEVAVVTCDLRKVEETRRNWPFLRDRRVDAFAAITRRAVEE
jgi:N-carbamoylputrescine amidase